MFYVHVTINTGRKLRFMYQLSEQAIAVLLSFDEIGYTGAFISLHPHHGYDAISADDKA